MNPDKIQNLKLYLAKVKSANKESIKKEIFKDLLNRLYAGDKEIEKIIDEITKGAERTVLNIPRKDRLHKGSADTLYNKIIIEFENDLKVTLKHAKEQLAGYLLGEFNSGEGYNFTLITSDFINWKVFAPDVSCLDKLANLKEDELILNEIKSASFTLTDRNTEDFYYWIDRFLFKEEKHRATLKRIEEAFGYQSNIFIESFLELTNHFNSVKKYGEVQVSYEQWSKFLSIAYGSFDASEENFIIHTYLSIFSKMLAYAVVSYDEYFDDDEMKGIIEGSIFHKYNIQNFVDKDFFHWIKSDRNFIALKKVFRLIAQEISTFDFHNVEEDILKGVYQELIDLDTRHALGEYYTPDWLCERIVKEFEFKKTDKILDPACGSGSFLLATVRRLRELNPEITIDELNNCVYGIDIHPLSVQIAKTTMLLALGKNVVNAQKPVHINVILANTLLAPDGVEDLFGKNFKMMIDKEKLMLNSQVLDDVELFDEALEACEELAEQTMHNKKATLNTFENVLKKQSKKSGFNKQIIESFYKVYESLKSVKEKGRNSIWKFIVQNLYKPYFLKEKFDYVIGNPPWFTYMMVKNEEYQHILNWLAENYNIKTKEKGTFAHLEIAAIFLGYCTNYFLKDFGVLSFVLPRSFFAGKQHENTRAGKVNGMRIKIIWDLEAVNPLFRIPSCVFFVQKSNKKNYIPSLGLEGKNFKGSLPTNNCKLNIAQLHLTEEPVKWYYIKQGQTTAIATKKRKSFTHDNPYKELFKAGATLRPRAFCFIEIIQETHKDFVDRILFIKTAYDIQEEAKIPWKGLSFEGKIESRFLFFTAISKSILPFNLFTPDLIVLPLIIDNERRIKLLESNELLDNGYINASKWFKNVENIWKIHRTELNKKYTAAQYLNYQNKIITQDLNKRFLVLYNSSAKDANSCILDRAKLDLEFIADHKTYLFATNKEIEAFYLTATLNSSIPNKMMKDFQTRGLFGARDVHKKILDIYFPRFDETNEQHLHLAGLGKKAHKKAEEYLKANPPQKELIAIHLGRLRLEIKKHLKKEMVEIDKLVKKIIG